MSAQVTELNPPIGEPLRSPIETLRAMPRPVKISVRNLNFFYGKTQALFDISMDIQERVVTAFIGPSGCGKSTFIRTLNRMNDVIAGTRVEGQVLIDGRDIYAPGTDVVELRRQSGNGVSEIKSISKIDLRQRCVRIENQSIDEQ